MLKDIAYCIEDNLHDPVFRAMMRNGCYLRSYQAEALRTIYDAVVYEKGGKFTVTFPRQSGKNETQAQLEAAVMAANLYRGGNIVKLIPSLKNQGSISRERLAGVLHPRYFVPGPQYSADARNSEIGTRNSDLSETERLSASKIISYTSSLISHSKGPSGITRRKNEITYGSTSLRCFSASPNSMIVGATADLLLEVDEAQLVPPDKFDREAAPMAVASNAVTVFWGTVWDDQTLLARETRTAIRDEEADRVKRRFFTDAAAVGEEVPEYADFVRKQVDNLGREHPVIRTQFLCEEISDLTAMFTPERIQAMLGSHTPLEQPENDRCYVFLVDIAGSDEMTARSREQEGFSDRRDATVLTICDVFLPPEDGCLYERRPIWNVAARRYYRNVPGLQLEEEIVREIRFWDPARVILDHSGLGCMLADALSRRFPHLCRSFDITAPVKTRMAWEFLSMVNGGRWKEYHVDRLTNVRLPVIKRGRTAPEILSDPALLQHMFIHELRACRMEPSLNAQTVRWGVPDGTRDPGTGRMIHDDLVMSAALSVLDEEDLVLIRTLPPWEPWKLARVV